jgi:tetratricopeptide (TPR) repeat protein
MQTGSEPPHLSEQTVKEALDRLLFNSRLRDDPSPLEKLLLVLERVRDPSFAHIAHPMRVALDEILFETITHTFNDLRRTLHLPSIVRQMTMKDVELDIEQIAHTRVPDLWAWAILYYQFAFTPVQVAPEIIAENLAVSDRTLKRYERWGVRRLTRKLGAEETALRRVRLERAMLARLPAEPGWRLVGRDEWLQRAMSFLHETPQRLLVSGETGVGKTAAVRALVMRLIEAGLVDQLLWLEAPDDADAVRAALREMACLPPDPQIVLNLREYLSGRRTVIALCRADGLLSQRESCERLLRELDTAMVIMTGREYVALRGLSVHLPLPPLDEVSARALGERLWHQFQSHVPRLHGELEYLLEMAKGNPEMLRWLISTHRPEIRETREASAVGHSLSAATSMMSMVASTMLYALMLFPEQGASSESLASIWGWAVASDGLGELAQLALLLRDEQRDFYALSSRARVLALESLMRNEALFENCLQVVDQALAHGSSEGLMLVESLLMGGRGLVGEARRRTWLGEGWRWAVESGRRSVWLALLRAATEEWGDQDARLWLGRAVCARGLALWEECAMALQNAIHHAGAIQQPDFVVQTEAVLERAVLYRLLGEYRAAVDDLERVQQRARHYRLPQLIERVALENAQISIDQKRGQDALRELVAGGLSLRQGLLKAEAYLLLQRGDECLTLLEHSRPRWEMDERASAAAYGLAGRALHHMGRLVEARRYFDVALTMHDRAEDMYSYARMSSNMGVLLEEMGALPLDVMALFRRAEREQRRLGDRVGLATTQANVRRLRGKFFDGKY